MTFLGVVLLVPYAFLLIVPRLQELGEEPLVTVARTEAVLVLALIVLSIALFVVRAVLRAARRVFIQPASEPKPPSWGSWGAPPPLPTSPAPPNPPKP